MRKSLLIFTIIILLSLSLLASFASLNLTAYAAVVEYYLASNDDVIFYDEQNKPLFIVPKTYYLLKNGEPLTGDYYRAIYNGIDGKLLKTSVNNASLLDIPSPYYSTNLSIASDRTSILVHKTPSSDSDERLFVDNMSTSFQFIGLMNDTDVAKTEKWYYVRYNTNKYGYIIPTHTNNTTLVTTIPVHANSIVTPPSPPPNEDINPNPNIPTEPTNNLLRVLLILGISVPAVIIVFLLFKPSHNKGGNRPRPRQRDYYDDYYDDYEDDYYYDNYRDNHRDYREPRRRR